MDAGFELFDHTADLGIRAWAPTPGGLVGAAAAGLYSAIGEFVFQEGSSREVVRLGGTDRALLLRDYLAELLLRFERDRLVGVEHAVSDYTETELVVNAAFRRLNEERSVFLREVKAITYHELEVRAVPDGWQARIIVDI